MCLCSWSGVVVFGRSQALLRCRPRPLPRAGPSGLRAPPRACAPAQRPASLADVVAEELHLDFFAYLITRHAIHCRTLRPPTLPSLLQSAGALAHVSPCRRRASRNRASRHRRSALASSATPGTTSIITDTVVFPTASCHRARSPFAFVSQPARLPAAGLISFRRPATISPVFASPHDATATTIVAFRLLRFAVCLARASARTAARVISTRCLPRPRLPLSRARSLISSSALCQFVGSHAADTSLPHFRAPPSPSRLGRCAPARPAPLSPAHRLRAAALQ